MNPILADMYSTVAPSAPFLIAAYALVWVALLVYVLVVVRGLKKTEAQMAALEESVRAIRNDRPSNPL
jgi:CcmD family protein